MTNLRNVERDKMKRTRTNDKRGGKGGAEGRETGNEVQMVAVVAVAAVLIAVVGPSTYSLVFGGGSTGGAVVLNQPGSQEGK